MISEFLGISRRAGGRESRASLENPAVSLNDPAAWDEMFGGGMRTDAGIMVSHRSALKFAPVWQAVSMISGSVAKMPLEVFKRLPDAKGREPDKSHPAYKLVRRQANREKHAFDFWRTLMVHALLWENGYAYIDRNGRGDPIELINLLPDRTAPERVNGQLVYVVETTRQDETPWLRALPADDVIHVRGISLDGLEGCDLVEFARNSWAVGLAAEGFAAKFFKHGVRSAGILELPVGLPKPASDKIVDGFAKYQEGPENWFKTVILRDGAKFHSVSINPSEGEMTPTREYAARDVARHFNMAPSRLGIKDSTSYNSKEEDNQSYLDDTLSPWMCSIVGECWMKLLSGAQQSADSHYFEHNTNSLLTMNPLKRSQMQAIGLRNGWLSPDEVRAQQNMNPRADGKGDQYVDIVAANGAGKGSVDNGQNQTTGDNPGTAKEKHALRRVVFNLGARARHKAKNPRAFVEWIDGGLVAHRDEARELLGNDAAVAKVLEELRGLVESVGNDGLFAAVDAAVTRYETEA